MRLFQLRSVLITSFLLLIFDKQKQGFAHFFLKHIFVASALQNKGMMLTESPNEVGTSMKLKSGDWTTITKKTMKTATSQVVPP